MPRPGKGQTYEKARDFKGAIKRLFSELNTYKILIIVAFTLAILGSILSILAPNRLSDLTDEISAGLVVNQDNMEALTKKASENLSEDKLKEVALFYARLFGYFPADLIEQCHQLVDAFALNLQDFPFEEQVLYLNKFLRTLKHEFILRIVESTINMRDIAEIITADNDEGEIPYSFCCPEVRETYIKRDKNVLEKIQQDPNLRTYIETSFGRKVEEIFSYLNAE